LVHKTTSFVYEWLFPVEINDILSIWAKRGGIPIKIIKSISIYLIIFIFLFHIHTFVSCAEVEENRGSEVVFLLDASNSMNAQDKNRLAIDAIRQMVYGLPSDYQTGFVAYSTEIQAVSKVGGGKEELEAQLERVRYTGYTNAGEGLSQAMDLFSDAEETDRYIVMLSDGEIVMKKNEDTEKSRAMFVDAAQRAKERGVKVYIVAIGEELQPKMHIFDAAEMTDGAIYWEGQSGSISQIFEQLMFHRFQVPKRLAGTTGGGSGNFQIKLPGTGASKSKILLTASHGISNVTADYTAKDGSLYSGQNFSVVQIDSPYETEVDVRFEAPESSIVQAYLMTEFQAELVTQIAYRGEEQPRSEEEMKKEIPPEYKHYADITIWAAEAGSQETSIWDCDYYAGQKVTYTINGIEYTGTIQDGKLEQSLEIDGMDYLSVLVDTGGFAEQYFMEQPVEAALVIPPDPEPEPRPDYRPLWIGLGVLAAGLLLILFLWVKKSRTTVIYMAQSPAARESGKKLETKNCDYTGKFNMYVIRTESGRDIPPQTFRLFGRKGGRMTLDWILNSCGLKFGKIGADDITFYPGPDQSIIIMDQSERCTVLRGTEILKKGMGYPVFFDEKLTICFEDETTEMEIHYKNLKPSER